LALKLRGALLGAGNIALRSHAPQWTRDEMLRREVEIVAVADLARTNLAAAREWLPDGRAYSNAEELLERESLDFCDICTPPSTHRRLIEIAAARGIHIVCEKPLAPTVDDAGHIARAVRGAGVVFRPCHQYHYSPQWQAVRELLPRIGHVRFAEYNVSRVGANEGNSHWSPSWRTDRSIAGGGILVDHGAHIIYQLRGVLGDPLTVHAMAARLLDPAYDVEDTALVALDYGDHLAHISLTWAARRRAIQFRFVGDRGELEGDDHSIQVHAARSERIEFGEGMSKNSSHSDWYTPLLRAFSAQVRDGRRDDDPLDEALHVTRVIDTAYESARLGKVLPFSPIPEPIPIPVRPTEAVRASNGAATVSVAESARRAPIEIGAATTRAATDEPEPKGWPLHPAVRAGGLVALVVIAFAAFRRVHWAEFWSALENVDLKWLALAAALNLGVIALAATRWFTLLRPISRRARWRDAFDAAAVGFAVSTLVPARGGDFVRAGMLSRRTGMSSAEIVGTIGLDQLLNAAGFMVGLAFLPWLGGVPMWMRPGAALALGLFGLAVAALFAWWPHRQPVGPAAGPRPAIAVGGVLARIRQGFRAVRSPRAIALAFAATIAAWALELAVLAVGLRAAGIALSLPQIVVVLMAVNVMLAIPMTPGNLGTLEVGATLGLLEFGVPREKALAFAICYHALQALPVAVLGFAIAVGEGLGRTAGRDA